MDLGFFDSHAHLTSEEMLEELEATLVRAEKAGVKRILNIATDLFSLEKGIALKRKYPWVFLAGATPPHDVGKKGEAEFSFFEKAAIEKQIVAIGETGLDYYYEHSPKKEQQKFFLRYVDLAKKQKLPLVFHCREAFFDLFSLTKKENIGAVLHCFTGTLKEAKEAIERGWFISFSGIVTFKKSQELRNIAKEIPLENLFIETDAPYLAPNSKRGKKNEPAFIVETASVLAEVKGVDLAEIKKVTYENTSRFLSLKGVLI